MKILKNEKGNITVLISVVMLILIAVIALVTDIGAVYAEKAKLSKAIDAAILAGGVELPSNITKAESVMEEYLLLNGVSLDQVEIIIAPNGESAEIYGTKSVDHYFAKIIGFTKSDIHESAKVVLGSASSVRGGIRPFGVTQYDFVYGTQVILKTGAGDGYNGNYGTIALGGNGASVLLDNALYGYDGEISIGDMIDTEPGNMAGAVNTIANYINSIDESFDNYERGSDRIWTLPIFKSMEVNGRKEIEVIAFGQFFVEDIKKKSGKTQITGRFIKYVVSGDIDETIDNTGVYAIKLVNN